MAEVRRARPTVYCLTNWVSAALVAQAVKSAGAGPVMATAVEDAREALAFAQAVLVNIGAWERALMAPAVAAMRLAAERGVAVVLDPVGAGAFANRTAVVEELLAVARPAIIRGNAAEIAALARSLRRVGSPSSPQSLEGAPGDFSLRLPPGRSQTTGPIEPGRGGEPGFVGVDAADPRPNVAEAVDLARRTGSVVACTGPEDVVTDGWRLVWLRGGHARLAEVVGTGCVAGALVAAACFGHGLSGGRAPGALLGAAAGLALSKAAGRAAGERSTGPGSFVPAFLDALADPEVARALPSVHVEATSLLSDRLRLYAIVDERTSDETIRAAVAGGATAVQLRAKDATTEVALAAARRIGQICRGAGALFFVNDRADVALAADADGVHLGQTDLPATEARRWLGPSKLLGVSVETEDEARAAESAGADYLGTGPIYATASKPDAGAPYGPDVVRRVTRATALPVVGIGGIGPGRARAVIEAGAAGVAVLSAITAAGDPAAMARALRAEVDAALTAE